MNCDMCGKDAPLFRTLVEGTEINVCEDCTRHGKNTVVTIMAMETAAIESTFCCFLIFPSSFPCP